MTAPTTRDRLIEPGTDVRRQAERFRTRLSWLDSKHSFSFSRHWDSGNTHHGLLLVNNDDIVVPGTGILHSEKNDAYRRPESTEQPSPVRFIQMWVPPDTSGISPGYEQLEIADDDLRRGLITIASGIDRHRDDTAIRIANRFVALHAARLDPGGSINTPDAPFAHLFVAKGSVDLEGAGPLAVGDAARLSTAGARRLSAIEPAEVLLWKCTRRWTPNERRRARLDGGDDHGPQRGRHR